MNDVIEGLLISFFRKRYDGMRNQNGTEEIMRDDEKKSFIHDF